MQTYDIALAGARNRYTILTDAGPIIVHNCGYGLGFANFAAQLLTGFLGAKPLLYTKSDAKALGVTMQVAEKFLENKESVRRMNEIPHTCTDTELLFHCLTAKAIIDQYRATASPIADFWEFLTGRIQRSLIDGEEYDHKGVLRFRKEEIVLVNGMSLKYPNLRQEDELDDKGKKTGKKQYVYDEGKRVEKLYGGRMANHVTQATSRVIMTDGMLRVDKKHPVLFTVHDEFGISVPEARAEEVKAWVHEEMTKTPTWMPGLPLNSDVGYNRRYGLAK